MQTQFAYWRTTAWTKFALAAGLVLLADTLLFDQPVGSTLALLTGASLAAAMVVHPALVGDRRAVAALIICLLATLLLADRPTIVGWVFFWLALGVAVLSERAPRVEDVWGWAQRLVWSGIKGVLAPVVDLYAALNRRAPGSLGRIIAAAILPVVGGAVFLTLFAFANPVIQQVVTALRLPEFSPARLIFWVAATIGAWMVLQPRALAHPWRLKPSTAAALPVGASVIASLVVFNLLFALQNGLDIVFLWSGAELPAGVTLAEYAHRGAYLLIVTALLAGAFVLLFLRPDAEGAKSRLVRGLVTAWVAQNLLLVASSMLRTWDYVEAYGLTRFRISALAWMVLVAVGLTLICVRQLRNRSAGWLVNRSLLAAGLVLTAAAVTDLGALAASWNVRHARETGGPGASLDLCYLRQLDDAALLPLIELEERPLPAALATAATRERVATMERLIAQQTDWRSWTWRGERRLQAARRRLRETNAPQGLPASAQTCQWDAPSPEPQLAPPLTSPPRAGT